MHPVLKKVPASNEQAAHHITDFLYAYPQIAEAIEWVYDNVDPVFAPDELGVSWGGFVSYDHEPRVPLVLTIKDRTPSWSVRERDREYDKLEEKFFAFLADLNRKFPDVDRLMYVVF